MQLIINEEPTNLEITEEITVLEIDEIQLRERVVEIDSTDLTNIITNLDEKLTIHNDDLIPILDSEDGLILKKIKERLLNPIVTFPEYSDSPGVAYTWACNDDTLALCVSTNRWIFINGFKIFNEVEVEGSEP